MLIVILCALSTQAQNVNPNQIFRKYSDMPNVQYISLSNSLLQNARFAREDMLFDGNAMAELKGLQRLIIIHSDWASVVMGMMDKDVETLKKQKNYEVLMNVKNNKEQVEQQVQFIMKETQPNSELVVYVKSFDLVRQETTGKMERKRVNGVLMILLGSFTSKDIAKLMAKTTQVEMPADTLSLSYEAQDVLCQQIAKDEKQQPTEKQRELYAKRRPTYEQQRDTVRARYELLRKQWEMYQQIDAKMAQ